MVRAAGRPQQLAGAGVVMQDPLVLLQALARERDWGKAARACAMSDAVFAEGIRAAEADYGCALVLPGPGYQGLTVQGMQVAAWSAEFTHALGGLKQELETSRQKKALAGLTGRRSISPKRLVRPGPTASEMDAMFEAALCAPDHGGLHPWRFLVFPVAMRESLAQLFLQEKLRRDPLATPEDLERAREHALRSPSLLAFVVSPRPRMRVPEREQWLAAGTALGNFLNAAHQLGFGAIVLSGERCFDAELCAALGLGPTESLAGFVSLGSIVTLPAERKLPCLDAVRSTWSPSVPQAPAAAPAASPETGR